MCLNFEEPDQTANKNIEFGCEKEALDINDQKSIDTVVQVCNHNHALLINDDSPIFVCVCVCIQILENY